MKYEDPIKQTEYAYSQIESTEIFSQVKSFIALMFADGGGAFYIWIFLFPVMESLAFRTNCL